MPGEALQLDIAAVVEGDVVAGDCVAHRLADQSLAAVGLRRHARRHRDIPAEQVVAAPHRLARVDADAHPDPVGAPTKCPLHVDAAPHRLLRLGEGDHEPVALALHDVTLVALHVPPDHLVVPADQPHPGPVPDALVERRGLLDVGEQDRDVAVRRQPGQVGPFHLGPVGEVLDRRGDRGAEPLLADDVGGLPHRLDRLAAAGQQHVAGVDPAAQLVGLASGAVELDAQDHDHDGLDRGDDRQHVGGDLRTCHRSSIGCWSREAAGALLREQIHPRERSRSCAGAMDALDAAAADGGCAGRRRVGDGVRPRRGRQSRAQAAVSDRPVRLRYDTWTARIGATSIDDRSACGSVTGAGRSARWDLRITPGDEAPVKLLTDRGYKAKFPTAKTMVRHPLARFDGSLELDDVRVRGRRLDRQRQPQLGPPPHARLRVRSGVRVRRGARIEPGDRHRARRGRSPVAACRHASGPPP